MEYEVLRGLNGEPVAGDASHVADQSVLDDHVRVDFGDACEVREHAAMEVLIKNTTAIETSVRIDVERHGVSDAVGMRVMECWAAAKGADAAGLSKGGVARGREIRRGRRGWRRHRGPRHGTGDRDGGCELHEHRVRRGVHVGAGRADLVAAPARAGDARAPRGHVRIARGNQGDVDETRRRVVCAVAPRVDPTLPPRGASLPTIAEKGVRREARRGIGGRAQDEVRRARDAERGAREGFVFEGPRRSDARDPERARGGRGGAQVRRRRRLRRLPLIGYPPALRRVQGHRHRRQRHARRVL